MAQFGKPKNAQKDCMKLASVYQEALAFRAIGDSIYDTR